MRLLTTIALLIYKPPQYFVRHLSLGYSFQGLARSLDGPVQQLIRVSQANEPGLEL